MNQKIRNSARVGIRVLLLAMLMSSLSSNVIGQEFQNKDVNDIMFWNQDLTTSPFEGLSQSGLEELIGSLSGPIDPGNDPDVPIDGGLSLLLAAGAGYGVRRLRRKKVQ